MRRGIAGGLFAQDVGYQQDGIEENGVDRLCDCTPIAQVTENILCHET